MIVLNITIIKTAMMQSAAMRTRSQSRTGNNDNDNDNNSKYMDIIRQRLFEGMDTTAGLYGRMWAKSNKNRWIYEKVIAGADDS
jgi:hypothetical protein